MQVRIILEHMEENNMEFEVDFDKISELYGTDTLNDMHNNIDEVMYPQWVVTEIKKIQSALSLFDS